MFTIVAYKPDSVDNCMGCRVASYSSGFISKSSLHKDELVKEWAEVLFLNTQLDYNESGYDVQIWQNSFLIWDEINHEEDTEVADLDFEHSQALELANKLHAENEAKIAATLAEEKEKKELKDREERFKQWNKLNHEFDPRSLS